MSLEFLLLVLICSHNLICILFANYVADIDAIKENAKKATEFLLAKEFDKAASFFAPDCRKVGPGGPIATGNEGMT